MNKQAVIDYLNSIRRYVNLTGLCKAYNHKNKNNSIDYNNLRCVLNGENKNRLSEEKLYAFFSFLKKDIFENEFIIPVNEISAVSINEIICAKTEEMKREIEGVLNNGFSTKQ
ncbi:MAG: hypothetical protein IKZ59_01395 [Clostridia bacterium]|nr:hypothetical protein [Clostridia bacterium]